MERRANRSGRRDSCACVARPWRLRDAACSCFSDPCVVTPTFRVNQFQPLLSRCRPHLSSLDGARGAERGRAAHRLQPARATDFSSASSGLWALTRALRQQLRVDHELAAALCLKAGMQNCKELREAKTAKWNDQRLSAADLATLGTLGSVLPALKELCLIESTGAVHNGVQRLAAGLGAGALPVVFNFFLHNLHMGDAGASALAAALGRGALQRLSVICLSKAAITDAGMVALAPALRRLPALDHLDLERNPIGDEGLAALVAPPPPAGALPPPTGGLARLNGLELSFLQITDAGCAALAATLDSGALPALNHLNLEATIASAAAKAAVYEALIVLKHNQKEKLAREVAAQRERVRARTADQCALCGQSGKELRALPGPHCVHPTTCESCTARLTRRIEKDPAVAVELLRMCRVCSAAHVSS